MDVKPCCVRLSVKPSRGLVDEKFTILVQEVFPGSYLTIHALHQSEEGQSWEAFAHYVAKGRKPEPNLRLLQQGNASKAYKVLEQHPQIIGSRIAMLGLSFGTSVVLKFAVYSKVMKVRCLVGISGIHEQPLGGTIKDILTHHHKNVEKVHRNKANELICRDLMLPVTTDPAFKVDMGRLHFPLLLVVGEDDQNWPAYEAAMDMKEMMEQAGNSHLLTVLSYPNTGHLIEPPYTLHTRSSLYKNVSTGDRVIILWGGEMVAHSRAQEDSWRKMLAFLKQNLFRGIKSHL